MIPAADSKSSLLPIRLGQATFQPRSPSTMGFWMILGFSANFPLSNPMKSIEIPCIFRSFHQISRSIPSEAVQLLGSSLWKWRPAESPESPDLDRRSSQIAEDIMVKNTAAVICSGHFDFKYTWLVVWNMNFIFHILGIIIPTDFHIFQRG